MNNRIKRLKDKLNKIETIVTDIKKEIGLLEKEIENTQKKDSRNKKKNVKIDRKKIENDFNSLYNKFLKNDNESINQYIDSKTKNELSTFCRVNNLPISTTKLTKDKIKHEIIHWFAQKKVVTEAI